MATPQVVPKRSTREGVDRDRIRLDKAFREDVLAISTICVTCAATLTVPDRDARYASVREPVCAIDTRFVN